MREPELFSLPGASRGPFGDEPPRWYRRRKREGAPGSYTRPLAFICGLAALTATQLRGLAAVLIPIALGMPTAALDAWWRRRQQRRREAILPEVKATG